MFFLVTAAFLCIPFKFSILQYTKFKQFFSIIFVNGVYQKTGASIWLELFYEGPS